MTTTTNRLRLSGNVKPAYVSLCDRAGVEPKNFPEFGRVFETDCGSFRLVQSGLDVFMEEVG